jgi:hypothetical protein
MTVLVFLACAPYTEDAFQTDYDAAFCDWQADCEDYFTYEECVQEAEDEPWEGRGCAYDEESAQDCVEQMELMPCGGDPEFPTACSTVWDC